MFWLRIFIRKKGDSDKSIETCIVLNSLMYYNFIMITRIVVKFFEIIQIFRLGKVQESCGMGHWIIKS